MLKVYHIIANLKIGGTEKVLSDLVNFSKNLNHQILVLGKKNSTEVKFKNSINPIYFNFNIFYFLFYILKCSKFDIYHFWMQKSIFISIFIRLLNFKKIIWSIHNNQQYIVHDNIGKILVSINCLFSKFVPRYIIFCNNSSFQNHNNFGNFHSRIIINNPIVMQSFKKKKIFKFNNKIIKFIIVANYHEVKNHKYLFEIFSNFKFKNFSIDLFGHNIDYSNKDLVRLIKDFKLENQTSLNGFSPTNNLFYNYDFSILVSTDESMPLVLLESIASKTLCISTNVGGVSDFLSADFLLELDKPLESSEKIELLIEKFSNEINYENYINYIYNNIEKNFDIYKILLKYESIWNNMLDSK